MKPRYRVQQGLRMPLGFPPEALESALRFVPDARDILVASYPKSGTTWLQYIVYLLVRGVAIGPEQSLGTVFPHLEESGAAAVAGLPRPRLIKTHLSRGLAPWSGAARYLFICRNPFDCVVSFYHHTRGFPRHYDFEAGRFDDFFECFLAGEVDSGDYFDHLLSWQAEAESENVLFLTYEGLQLDIRRAIREIAAFLEDDVRLDDLETGLEVLVAETSLDAMRRNQQRWSSRRPDSAAPFVRSGRVGGWRDQLEPRQARALLAKLERCLDEAGIANPWPELTAEVRAFAEAGAGVKQQTSGDEHG